MYYGKAEQILWTTGEFGKMEIEGTLASSTGLLREIIVGKIVAIIEKFSVFSMGKWEVYVNAMDL